MKLRQRIEAHSIPEPNSGCWLWIGASRSPGGYGKIRVDGQARRAHRVAYEASRGPIPPGLHVLHRCDMPCCVNPEHLFLGTHADNMADMARKGRHSPGACARGRAHGSAKLTEADVVAIRADNRPSRQIASEYGLCRETVGDIKRRDTWRHVP